MTTNANECRECAFAQASYRKGSQDFPTCLAHRTTNATHTPGPSHWNGSLFCGCHMTRGIGKSGPAVQFCPMHHAAPELLAALEAVATLPGFEADAPYGLVVLAAIRKARGG